VKLTRRAEGAGELEVYFDPAIPVEEKIIFARYVHEHLLSKAQEVVRLRHYVCPHCGTPVGNREIAMTRLESWLAGVAGVGPGSRKAEKPSILCVQCEKRVPLWDELEQQFASAETQRRVVEMQEQSAQVLDEESRERALVGEVISTVALAGQIARELAVSDHGIDMEVEFRDDAGRATGRKVWLVLESSGTGRDGRRISGDVYVDHGPEVLTSSAENTRYWMERPDPVMLLVRRVDERVWWMDVREWVRRESEGGKKGVRQIAFKGERFDVMAVRGWRERGRE
jgi:hypothetical protein